MPGPERRGTPAPATMLRRALLRRCPVCGRAPAFDGFFTMKQRCPSCGYRYERIEGQWLGSLGLNTIVSFGTLFAVLLAGVALTWPDLPVLPLSLLGAAVAVVVPLAFFPWSRTLWSAIDLWMRPLEPGEAEPPPDGTAG